MKDLADHLPPRLGAVVRRAVAVKLTITAIATLILPVTFLLVVLFRYVFRLDLFAYEEWLLPISFWLYFLASAVGSYQDTQIRADVLESLFY
jgi:TRAP-type C4-dicarboxylate transport system permease small subunit